MEKQEVHSFNDIVNCIKNSSADFRELIDLCRKTHELAFDYNTAKTFDSETKTKELQNEIRSQLIKILDIIKNRFSYNSDTMDLTEDNLFNEIIMAISKVEDR